MVIRETYSDTEHIGSGRGALTPQHDAAMRLAG